MEPEHHCAPLPSQNGGLCRAGECIETETHFTVGLVSLNTPFGGFRSLECTLETCRWARWALGDGESLASYEKWVPCFSAAAPATQLLPELRVLMADLSGRWTLQAQEQPRGRRSPGLARPRGCGAAHRALC